MSLILFVRLHSHVPGSSSSCPLCEFFCLDPAHRGRSFGWEVWRDVPEAPACWSWWTSEWPSQVVMKSQPSTLLSQKKKSRVQGNSDALANHCGFHPCPCGLEPKINVCSGIVSVCIWIFFSLPPSLSLSLSPPFLSLLTSWPSLFPLSLPLPLLPLPSSCGAINLNFRGFETQATWLLTNKSASQVLVHRSTSPLNSHAEKKFNASKLLSLKHSSKGGTCPPFDLLICTKQRGT